MARLKAAFPRPSQLMGEAWFMGPGEREMYTHLAGDLDVVPVCELQGALDTIASGTSSFGPYGEWAAWYPYLLAQTVERSHETFVDALLELLVTAFITQYPAGLHEEPYPDFRRDALDTLGRRLMDSVCWPDGELDVHMCLNKHYCQDMANGRWWNASPKLSASLFFCLRYLHAGEIGAWAASIFDIPNAFWRAQMIVWSVGAWDVLDGRLLQPADFKLGATPSIDWAWSHCLSGNYTGDHSGAATRPEFVPAANRAAFIRAVNAAATEEAFLMWMDSISSHKPLEIELGDIPYRFFELYGSPSRG